MKKAIILVLLAFLIACAPTGNVAQPVQEIKLGVIAPLTGPVARFGEYMREGFELAVEEINSAGGVDGKQIKLIYEDTKCIDLAGTSAALKKLKEVDNVAAILGPYCGSTNKLAGQFSTDNDIFIISPGDNFGYTGEYKVNTRYHINKEARLLAEFALEQGWNKLGILYYNNDWGQAYRDGIQSYLEEHGGELIVAEGYTFDNLDARTQLLKIKKANPDAVVITDATSGELFQQAREVDLDKPFLSEWEIEKPETKGVAGEAIEGVFYFLPVEKETEFHKKFKEKYGKDANVAHVDSYDAAMILAKALQTCPNYDPECMLVYVTNLKDYQGAGGSMTFDKESWSFDKTFVLKTVKDGKYIRVEK